MDKAHTKKYNTNLAAEFHVLSMLHRLGLEATLTLGNKKAVDIFIFKPDGKTLTIDVKGLANKYDWPADNLKVDGKRGHYIILVCFNAKKALRLTRSESGHEAVREGERNYAGRGQPLII